MQAAPTPKNEQQRLKTLRALKILDTEPEERFDRITSLATQIFKVPISTITMVDENREWHKSVCGLDELQGDRAISFCGHAINQDHLVINDAKKDERFKDNPMVIGPPYIRFYAGISLKASDGNKIGTLCLKDTKPRQLTSSEFNTLKSLAVWVELEINLHELKSAVKLKQQLDDVKEKHRIIEMLSHQLRTPVGSMKWAMEEVASEIKNQESRNQIINKLESLTNIINTFLLYVEISKGYQVEKTEKFDLVNEAKIALNKIQTQFSNRKINLTFKNPNTPHLVLGIKEKIDFVFCALLHNAISYTKENGQIEVSLFKRGQYAGIQIKDTGIGIPKDEQPKIFTQLFRSKSASLAGKNEGSGLNLYLSKIIIEAHKGNIGYESTENKGSTFFFQLPLAT